MVALGAHHELVVRDEQIPRVAHEAEFEEIGKDCRREFPLQNPGRGVKPEFFELVRGVVVDIDADRLEEPIAPVMVDRRAVAAAERAADAHPRHLGDVDVGEAVGMGDEHGTGLWNAACRRLHEGAPRGRSVPNWKPCSKGSFRSPQTTQIPQQVAAWPPANCPPATPFPRAPDPPASAGPAPGGPRRRR